MTISFRQSVDCPTCGTTHTEETAFSRWIRANPRIDSRNGYCVTDQDIKIHQFKTFGRREFQLFLEIEVKQHGAALTPAQRDSLHIHNQIIRNRRQTPTKGLKFQAGTSIQRAYSVIARADVWVRHFGIHVLRFAGSGPGDSGWIMWDHTPITEDQLTALLALDIDPDTLKPLDLRSHHPDPAFRSLPLFDQLMATTSLTVNVSHGWKA